MSWPWRGSGLRAPGSQKSEIENGFQIKTLAENFGEIFLKLIISRDVWGLFEGNAT
jgi:hypothetical protein